jgi:hypothetical protein
MTSSRVVVVVPRHETALHEYLRRSLASLEGIEVVLDRRGASVTSSDERRRHPSENAERKLLLCSLVHCPAPSPTARPEPPVAADHGAHRTLLWPALRLENL